MYECVLSAYLEVVPLRELHLLPTRDTERGDRRRRLCPHQVPLLGPPLAHPRLLQHNLGRDRRRPRAAAEALARPQVVRAGRAAAFKEHLR